MAGKEFQGARDSLVAELSAARKIAAKSKIPKRVQGDGRKNRKNNRILAEWEMQGVQLQDFRLGAEVEK